MVLLWVILQYAEEWWPATILMFAPRWVIALPVVLLVPLALARRSTRLFAVLLASSVVALGSVAGFNVPWSALVGPRPSGMPFRVATINMHYSKGHTREVEELVASTWPDVIAIQEWPGARKTRLRSPESGWHVHATEELFLASRHPIRRAVDLGDRKSDQFAPSAHYELETPAGVVHLVSLHTESSRDGISETLRDYRKGSSEVRNNSALRRQQSAYIASRTRDSDGPVIVLGDFNTPPESPIMRDVWRGYTDAFDVAGWGFGYTFLGAKTTVRIDHILVDDRWSVDDCWVGPKVGSPHRPVLADLILRQK